MKKIVPVTLVTIAILFVLNLLYYRHVVRWQYDFESRILQSDIERIEDEVSERFQTQLLKGFLISGSEIHFLITKPDQAISVRNRIMKFFQQQGAALRQMHLIDGDGHSVTFERVNLKSEPLCKFEKVNIDSLFNDGVLIDSLQQRIICRSPLWDHHVFNGYIEIQYDIDSFFSSRVKLVDPHEFFWVVSQQGGVIYTSGTDIIVSNISDFNSQFSSTKDFAVVHPLRIHERIQKCYTVRKKFSHQPITFYLCLSVPVSVISSSVFNQMVWVTGISIFLLVVIITVFVIFFQMYVQQNRRSRVSHEAVRKIIYYLPLGVILLDNRKKILQANRQLMKLLNIEDEDFLLSHIVGPEILFKRVELLDMIQYNEISSKFVIRQPDGNEVVIINERVPLYVQRDKRWMDIYMVLNDNDLTNRERTAQNIFVANISHELRTPLNGIIGMIDLLSQSRSDGADDDILAILKRSSETLLSLINDILDFSKIQSGKFEIESIPFDIHHETCETIKAFESKAKDQKLLLSWHCEGTLPEDFIGDPIRYRQILNNLLSNALKFTSQGKVHVQIGHTRLVNGNPALLISVKDTGIGIVKEKQREIFKSFQQADESTTRKYGGTGLGTTISKELVHLMGGDIWVTSPTDLSDDPNFPGSEFCFTLPVRTMRHLKTINTSSINLFSQIRCIIVTDDPLHVQVMCGNLSALRIDWRTMSPSQETIDMLRTTQKYQMLVIDNRPDFNGLDFLQELHNHHLNRNYIILFQSSDIQNTNTGVARRLGADAYLRKPVKLVVLRDFLLKHFPAIETRVGIEAGDWDHSLKILLAEDNLLNQKVAQSLFRKLGFKIDVASNGLEAIELSLKNHHDIVFMDIYMPEKDGIEAMSILKKKGFTGTIIAMTSSNDIGERRRAMDAGMDDFISKPARLEDLQRMLAKWCSIEAAVPHSVE